MKFPLLSLAIIGYILLFQSGPIVHSKAIILQEPTPKFSIPNDSTQKMALALVTEVYKPDYEKAKTPDQKLKLAKKLFNEGIATMDDPVNRFVLFRIAKDLTAQQGDLTTAFLVIDQISLDFEADRMQLIVDAATTAIKVLKFPKDLRASAALLDPLIDEAISTDRYDTAKTLVTLAIGCARECGDSALNNQLTSKMKDILEIVGESEKVKEAKVTLVTRPTDPTANLAMGKFLCLFKGDWKRGVSMLALGSNEEFKSVALLEIADSPDPLKIGEEWWKISEGLKGLAKLKTQVHSVEWYRKALPGLSGLTRTRVERLVSQVPLPQMRKDTKVPMESLPKDKPMRKPSFIGRWVQANGWAIEILENGEARNTTPKGAIDTSGKWQDDGNGKISIRLGKNNEWQWNGTLQGNTMNTEIFLNGTIKSKSAFERQGIRGGDQMKK